jgi:hypothetical protein
MPKKVLLAQELENMMQEGRVPNPGQPKSAPAFCETDLVNPSGLEASPSLAADPKNQDSHDNTRYPPANQICSRCFLEGIL